MKKYLKHRMNNLFVVFTNVVIALTILIIMIFMLFVSAINLLLGWKLNKKTLMIWDKHTEKIGNRMFELLFYDINYYD